MDWIVFSYSLPAHASTPRVTLWRRLRRLGAISPTGSLYILPAQDECLEAFHWLAQEIQQAEGEALVMHVSRFERLGDEELIALFNRARQEDYEEIAVQLAELERRIESGAAASDILDLQATLHKFQKQHAEIARVDYFQSPQGTAIAARLNQVSRQISPGEESGPQIAAVSLAQYQDTTWVTRPRPHVDRLACAWLIRRYVNPGAVIRYASTPEPGEVAFDMESAEFSHRGNLCTFEVMIRAFELQEPALYRMAEIVHEIDLRDGRYQHPETPGIDAALRGWLLGDMPDGGLEAHGLALFDGLYAALSQSTGARR